MDPWYPEKLQIGSEATEQAKIRVALYKMNPDGTNGAGTWEAWAYNGAVTQGGKVSGSTETKTDQGTIEKAQGGTPEAGEITVTFPIKNVKANNDSTVSWYWDDEAKYCIVAWNQSNRQVQGDGSEVEFTQQNLNPGNGSQRTYAPSVATAIDMQWQESSYYVYIPANVVLTESGANVSGSSDGYAGAEATVRYKNADTGNPAEGNNEKVQPEVEVQVQDDQKLAETGGSKNMTMGIYGTDGVKRQASSQTNPTPTIGYVYIGLLTTKTGTTTWANGSETLPAGKSFDYQINAKTNGKEAKGTTYTGTVNYILTLRDYERK